MTGNCQPLVVMVGIVLLISIDIAFSCSGLAGQDVESGVGSLVSCGVKFGVGVGVGLFVSCSVGPGVGSLGGCDVAPGVGSVVGMTNSTECVTIHPFKFPLLSALITESSRLVLRP